MEQYDACYMLLGENASGETKELFHSERHRELYTCTNIDMGEEQYEFTQDRMAHKLVTVHKSTFQTMDDMLSQADANISLKELRGVCPYVYGNGCVGYQTTDVDYTDLDFYYNKCRKFHERGYTNVRVLFGIAAV